MPPLQECQFFQNWNLIQKSVLILTSKCLCSREALPPFLKSALRNIINIARLMPPITFIHNYRSHSATHELKGSPHTEYVLSCLYTLIVDSTRQKCLLLIECQVVSKCLRTKIRRITGDSNALQSDSRDRSQKLRACRTSKGPVMPSKRK